MANWNHMGIIYSGAVLSGLVELGVYMMLLLYTTPPQILWGTFVKWANMRVTNDIKYSKELIFWIIYFFKSDFKWQLGYGRRDTRWQQPGDHCVLKQIDSNSLFVALSAAYSHVCVLPLPDQTVACELWDRHPRVTGMWLLGSLQPQHRREEETLGWAMERSLSVPSVSTWHNGAVGRFLRRWKSCVLSSVNTALNDRASACPGWAIFLRAPRKTRPWNSAEEVTCKSSSMATTSFTSSFTNCKLDDRCVDVLLHFFLFTLACILADLPWCVT